MRDCYIVSKSRSDHRWIFGPAGKNSLGTRLIGCALPLILYLSWCTITGESEHIPACSDTLEWYHSYWPATIIHLSMLCPIMHHHSSTRQMLGISYNIMETWLKRVPLVIKVFHLPLCIMRASNHTAKVKHLGSLVYHNTCTYQCYAPSCTTAHPQGKY